jgi:hypothetical protein
MRIATYLSLVTGLFVGFLSCKSSAKITLDGKQISSSEIIQVKNDAAYIQPVSNPAFTIEDWSIEGDYAKIILNYSGGCGTHKFKAFFTGAYMKSLPPKASIFIQHENGGDKCRMLIMDTLYVNLKPVRYNKDKAGSVIIGFNNTEKTVEYKHD